MRFRLGYALGFGTGYYLGSKAGRERYEQINRTVRNIKRSDVYETATERAREVVDTGVAKAKEVVDSARHHNGNGDEPATVVVTNEPYLPPSEPLP